MRIAEIQFEFLKDVAKLIHKAEKMRLMITGGELYRTKEQQKIYMEQGLTQTMNSLHLLRLAIDFNIFIWVVKDDKGYWKLAAPRDDFEVVEPLGKYWEKLNEKNRWGGYFKTREGKPFRDIGHFERRLK